METNINLFWRPNNKNIEGLQNLIYLNVFSRKEQIKRKGRDNVTGKDDLFTLI